LIGEPFASPKHESSHQLRATLVGFLAVTTGWNEAASPEIRVVLKNVASSGGQHVVHDLTTRCQLILLYALPHERRIDPRSHVPQALGQRPNRMPAQSVALLAPSVAWNIKPSRDRARLVTLRHRAAGRKQVGNSLRLRRLH
jgi:hypothetical protein